MLPVRRLAGSASALRISEGQAPLDGFLEAVRRQLGELVARAKGAGVAALRLPTVETRPCRAPGCAGALRKRVSKNGPFWACSRYPECKFTENAGSSAQHKARARRPRQRAQAR